MKETSSTNLALKHSLLEAIGKRLGDEKALFDFFGGLRIRDFDDTVIVLY